MTSAKTAPTEPNLYYVVAYSHSLNEHARFIVSADDALSARSQVLDHCGNRHKVEKCLYVGRRNPLDESFFMEV